MWPGKLCLNFYFFIARHLLTLVKPKKIYHENLFLKKESLNLEICNPSKILGYAELSTDTSSGVLTGDGKLCTF